MSHDDERPQDQKGAHARPAAPASEDEAERRPDDSDPGFFDTEEHDGWAPIRKRVEEPPTT